jgi:hypothetical protein
MLEKFLNENKKVAIIVGTTSATSQKNLIKIIESIESISVVESDIDVYFADSTVPQFDYSIEKAKKIISNGLNLRVLYSSPSFFFRGSAYAAIRKNTNVALVVLSDVDKIDDKDLGLNTYQNNKFIHIKV